MVRHVVWNSWTDYLKAFVRLSTSSFLSIGFFKYWVWFDILRWKVLQAYRVLFAANSSPCIQYINGIKAWFDALAFKYTSVAWSFSLVLISFRQLANYKPLAYYTVCVLYSICLFIWILGWRCILLISCIHLTSLFRSRTVLLRGMSLQDVSTQWFFWPIM